MENFVYLFLFVSLCVSGVKSQPVVSVSVTTPSPSPDGQPNTILGTAGQFAVALLNSSTPALLWGIVPSTAVAETCKAIVATGSHSVIFEISKHTWTFPLESRLRLQVLATGGCLALPDSSQTQFLFQNEHQRRIAVACPWSNAGELGCGVYVTGCDIDDLFHEELRLYGQDDCAGEDDGMIFRGEVTGVLDEVACSKLDPAIVKFCKPGELGVQSYSSCSCEYNCCNSCFPGNARVELATGSKKQMKDLAIGDKIAVEVNGKMEFQDVYAFGHKDKKAFSEFVKIHTSNNETLEISHRHLVPTLLSTGQVMHKRAQDVEVGDILMVTVQFSNILMPSKVTEVSSLFSEGLFNPFTLSGTIIVDGVVASVHSEWFLDNIFDALGFVHLLPAAYQFVLLPARILYKTMGAENYAAGYNWIDSGVDIAETGTKFGGTIAVTALLLVLGAGIKSGMKTGNV